MEPILKTIGSGSSPTRLHWRHDCPPPIASIYGTLRAGGNRECEVLHIRMRTETESKKRTPRCLQRPPPIGQENTGEPPPMRAVARDARTNRSLNRTRATSRMEIPAI